VVHLLINCCWLNEKARVRACVTGIERDQPFACKWQYFAFKNGVIDKLSSRFITVYATVI
jgi:hypothetical protein